MLAITSVIRHLIAGVATILIFSVGILVSLLNRKAIPRISKLWSHAMLKIYGISASIIDENSGNYSAGGNLFVTLNQSSLVESYVGIYAHPVPCRVIMNIEYLFFHLSGWFELAKGSIVVIRQWPAQAKRAINRSIGRLARKDCNFWISIEGKRSPDGALQPYKKGTAVIAIESQCTIIPIIFIGARERMRLGDWKVNPGPVKVVLCKAVSTTGMTYGGRDQLISTLRGIAEQTLSAYATR